MGKSLPVAHNSGSSSSSPWKTSPNISLGEFSVVLGVYVSSKMFQQQWIIPSKLSSMRVSKLCDLQWLKKIGYRELRGFRTCPNFIHSSLQYFRNGRDTPACVWGEAASPPIPRSRDASDWFGGFLWHFLSVHNSPQLSLQMWQTRIFSNYIL